jgi:AbrB family looped-hinge helix DNA binding protein
MLIVTVSNRGQIVIPKEVRKKLKIVPGKKLLIKTEGDHILLTPLPDDPVEHFCGIFKEGPSLTKALLDERRKERALLGQY